MPASYFPADEEPRPSPSRASDEEQRDWICEAIEGRRKERSWTEESDSKREETSDRASGVR